MNKEVYQHFLQSYGRNTGWWASAFCELIRTLSVRFFAAIIIAQATSYLAAGNMVAARDQVLPFLALAVGGAFIGALGEIIGVRAENNTYNRLRMNYYLRLVGKDMSFYRDHQTGYLTSLFRQYLDSLVLFSRFLRVEMLRIVLSMFVPVVVLWLVDWRLGIISVLIVVVQMIYVFWASAKANKYRAWTHEIYRKMTAEVADEITNIVAFKSSGAEEKAHGKVQKLGEEETRAFWLRRKTSVVLDLPRDLVTTFGIAAALYVIVIGAQGVHAVGLIVLTFFYLFQITRAVSELPSLIVQHDDYITKLHPTLAYLGREHETITDPANPKKLRINEGAIDIQAVDFYYPSRSKDAPDIAVFKNLNLHIQGGEQVGIVGLSGAGKSTLASLLMRFDDVGGGSISIDGIDIRDVRQSELRSKVAYVPQEPLLFHRTIAENIAYFNDTANQQNIVAAARAAHAHEFISKLPDGYDTIVGERGVKLSGGQKQRVVIARAILKNAPIMIFDEATSALDSESEQIIQHALPEIIGKHTAIVIAHRLSTVAGLDRIIVMHEGQIIEEGTHHALLKKRGQYYSLWQKQTSA